jgi:adhesin transport system outer membrane protein
MDIALQENLATGNSGVTMKVARTQKAIRRAEYFPTFDLVGIYNFEKNNGATLGVRRDYSLQLQANMNLFNGFSTEAGISQTNFDYRASQDSHLFVTRQIIQQPRLAWQALVTARQRVALLENAVTLHRKYLRPVASCVKRVKKRSLTCLMLRTKLLMRKSTIPLQHLMNALQFIS